MVTGSCTTTNNCFYSPNYPDDYDNDDSCNIFPQRSGTLIVEDFDVETESSCGYDYLKVDGTKYCGTDGPDDVLVDTSMKLKWRTDDFIVSAGFEICLSPSPTASPTISPVPTATPTTPAPTVTPGPTIAPTLVPTTFPTAEPSYSVSCYEHGDSIWTGGCGTFEKETDEWCKGYCFAPSADDCCETDGTLATVSAVSGVVFLAGVSLAIFAICRACKTRSGPTDGARILVSEAPGAVAPEYQLATPNHVPVATAVPPDTHNVHEATIVAASPVQAGKF